jgi:BA14K-like protein
LIFPAIRKGSVQKINIMSISAHNLWDMIARKATHRTEEQMSNVVRKSAATILIAASIASLATVTSAAPMVDALAIKNSAAASVETVRWGGRGWGWGVGGGLLAGAIIGGALAAPYYYGPGYYPGPYYPAPAYYGGPAPGYYGGPAPGYNGGPPAGDVSYCMQRFRSYDPRSGTYMGNDGQRHSCP